jgi:hypothetical protein
LELQEDRNSRWSRRGSALHGGQRTRPRACCRLKGARDLWRGDGRWGAGWCRRAVAASPRRPEKRNERSGTRSGGTTVRRLLLVGFVTVLWDPYGWWKYLPIRPPRFLDSIFLVGRWGHERTREGKLGAISVGSLPWSLDE